MGSYILLKKLCSTYPFEIRVKYSAYYYHYVTRVAVKGEIRIDGIER